MRRALVVFLAGVGAALLSAQTAPLPFQPTLVGGLDDAGLRHIFNTDPTGNIIIANPGGGGSGGSGGGPVTQGGPFSVLIVYDGGSLPVTGTFTASTSIWDAGVYVQGGQLTLSSPDWDAGVIVLSPVAISSLWDGGVLVQNFPASFGATQQGNWSVLINYDGGALPVSIQGGAGSGWDAGVLVQNTVSVSIADGGVGVTNFPAVQAVSIVDGGFPAVQAVWIVDGGGSVNFPSVQAVSLVDGGVGITNFPATQAVTQSGPWTALLYYDGGGLPITGSVTVTFPSVQSVSIVDGGIGITNFPLVQAVSIVDGGAGGGGGYDAGFLAYTYAGPLPADTSYQTSCTNSITFCGTTSTALTACSGGKWQDFQNQSSQSIYICAQAGCSAPTAVDAGTAIGEAIPAAATYFANGSTQYWCVVPTSPQTSADAGTVTKCCK
jgi:hypothetical protein